MTSSSCGTRNSDLAYQAEVLQGVSRTFALTIPELPDALCDVVSNAYLLSRITDTIEDEPALCAALKEHFWRRFVDVVEGRDDAADFAQKLGASLSSSTTASEYDLVANTTRVLRITEGFRAVQRRAIERCVRIMSRGMAEFQQIDTSAGLEDMARAGRVRRRGGRLRGRRVLRPAHRPAVGEHSAHSRPTRRAAAGLTAVAGPRVEHGGRRLSLPPSASCEEQDALCTADGRPLSNAISVPIQGPPSLSVADAEVEEGPNAALAFAVTLGWARELHPFEALELATVIEAVKLHVLHGWPRWWAWTFASLVTQIAIDILEAAAGELVIVDHDDHDVGETIH